MTTNFKINHTEKTIIVSRKIAKKTEMYGSAEYKQLQAVRKDYPEFKVEFEKTMNSRKDNLKGLTYEFMESYITNHDPSGEIMEEYLILRGANDFATELEIDSVSYGEIKSWFLTTYPEIKKFFETRDRILSKNVA